MKYIENVLKSITLIIWLLSGVYYGVQGVVLLDFKERQENASQGEEFDEPKLYKGVKYVYKEALRVQYDIEALDDFFVAKSLIKYPAFLLLILTSCSFGLVGSSIMLSKGIVLDKTTISFHQVLFMPILGLFAGIVVMAFAELVPIIITEQSGTIRPIALVFMAFFGGLFVDKFYNWTENKFNSIFN